jgi:hypothetical protein
MNLIRRQMMSLGIAATGFLDDVGDRRSVSPLVMGERR